MYLWVEKIKWKIGWILLKSWKDCGTWKLVRLERPVNWGNHFKSLMVYQTKLYFQTILYITYNFGGSMKPLIVFVKEENVVFWPSTRPKMPFKVMHRKEVTHSNGSYERKSRGWKLADAMGRAKKSHDTLIDWRTGREWPLNCMTVISAWWRLNVRFQRSSGRSSGCWTII